MPEIKVRWSFRRFARARPGVVSVRRLGTVQASGSKLSEAQWGNFADGAFAAAVRHYSRLTYRPGHVLPMQ